MSESSLPETTPFWSRLLSDLQQFLSFMHSHPLYFFLFFFFFSPYLIKFFSFLSPLFITTSLLLLAFLTLSPGSIHENSKIGLLFSTYKAVIERLRTSNSELDNNDEEFRQFEELEAYKIVFDTSSFYEVSEGNSEENCSQELGETLVKPCCDELDQFAHSEEKTVEVAWEEIKEVKSLEGLFKELDDFDNIKLGFEDKKVNLPSTEPDEDEENRKGSPVTMGSEAKECFKDISVEISTDNGGEYTSKAVTNNSVEDTSKTAKSFNNTAETGNGGEYTSTFLDSPSSRSFGTNLGASGGEYKSKAVANAIAFENSVQDTLKAAKSFNNTTDSDNGGEYTSKFLDSPSSRTFGSNLGAYGSMRRDKEWKRTLACKLFEERHNANGCSPEGMDSLWETYEMDRHSKAKSKSDNKSYKSKKKDETESDEDDDCDEGMDAKLCCLQALKFSTGKMNMGMGRPNLMKFTKAIKGMGWLVNKHGKKGKVET